MRRHFHLITTAWLLTLGVVLHIAELSGEPKHKAVTMRVAATLLNHGETDDALMTVCRCITRP